MSLVNSCCLGNIEMNNIRQQHGYINTALGGEYRCNKYGNRGDVSGVSGWRQRMTSRRC